MIEVRPLAPEDYEAAWRLGGLAFGADPAKALDPALPLSPATRIGAFDGGELVGKLAVLEYAQWFGGRSVAMAGVAGVAIAPERRGNGLARRLVAAGLAAAREQGAGVSMLYPTAVGLYRSMGWELAGAMSRTRVPTGALARAGGSVDGVTLRRCTAAVADVDAVGEVYSAVARTTTGLLTRTGPMFATGPAGVLEHDVVTLAVENGAVTGYVAYGRGRGYGADSCLTVDELLARTPGALVALLRQLGSWRAVAPHCDLRLLAADAASLVLPDALPPAREVTRWMLRIVNVERAIARRGFPAGAGAEVDLEIADEHLPEVAGRWQLRVVHGRGQAVRGGTGAVRVDVRGLSALYAGSASAAALVRAGLMDGPSADVAMLETVLGGPPAQCLDYF